MVLQSYHYGKMVECVKAITRRPRFSWVEVRAYLTPAVLFDPSNNHHKISKGGPLDIQNSDSCVYHTRVKR